MTANFFDTIDSMNKLLNDMEDINERILKLCESALVLKDVNHKQFALVQIYEIVSGFTRQEMSDNVGFNYDAGTAFSTDKPRK